MAYSIIAQNNSTTTLADENGNVITVPSRSILDAGTTFTLVKINNNTATLEDSNGKVYRDIPCCIDLTQVTGFNVTKVNNNKATLEDGDGNVYAGVPCIVNLTGTGGGSAVIEELNVTPSTSAQTITASGGVDGYSPVNVSAVDASIDANIVAGNIKNGVEILGVTGSVIELNGETKTVTPQVYGQTLYPTAPKNAITEITVNAVTSSIDANIQAGNIKKDVTILGVTGSYEGTTPTGTISITSNGIYNVTNYASANVSVSGGGKYALLDRVKDDNNVEIGTVVGFRKDSNNNDYVVVCLDARYRSDEWFALISSAIDVDDIPTYAYGEVFGAKETATENCDAIISAATSHSTTCPAVTLCRNNSFVIDNTTYYGQLPSLPELIDIFNYVTEINNLDPDKNNPTYEYYLLAGTGQYWSSTQNSTTLAWRTDSSNGAQPLLAMNKTQQQGGIAPILELPNS